MLCFFESEKRRTAWEETSTLPEREGFSLAKEIFLKIRRKARSPQDCGAMRACVLPLSKYLVRWELSMLKGYVSPSFSKTYGPLKRGD